MNSIPASQLVNVIPSVLGAGGNPLSLNAVFLTSSASMPNGPVIPFADQADVADYFGAESDEAGAAAIYFNGFDGATVLPSLLYFGLFNTAAVGAFVRGGALGLTLTQLQALSGTITVNVDGAGAETTASISLAGATSFSNAASLIQAALVTATSTALCTYDQLHDAIVFSSATTGATSTLSAISGTLAAGIKATAATGAIYSPGAAIAVPATVMNAIAAETQNWATFMTVQEAVLATKEAFAAWVTTQNDRFVYVCQDSDATALTSSASGCFGVLTANDDGVCPVWSPNYTKAAFICGFAASIDFTATNGRATAAYKAQAGLVADITDATTAQNLIANGYNFYGAYATANQAFTFLQPGKISGAWLWLDTFLNQIALNAAFQLALMELLANTKALPYNQLGYGLMRSALLDPITQFLAFGAIQPGVTLSNAQAAEINTAAGGNVAPTIQNSGWYLQIKDPGSVVRGQRGSPVSTFWYTDGGSIQKITLASIDVE